MCKLLFPIIALLALVGAGCTDRQSATTDADSGNIFHEAVFVSGTLDADSAGAVISVVNPWDSTAMLATYRVRNIGAPALDSGSTPEGAIALALPLKRLIVYSAVHAALLVEMGYADAIVGVADAAYIKTPEITERLADGRITDVGSSMEPSLEKILSLKPDAVLISPFQNSGHGVLDKTEIPVIECADYMETSPLGRAEWSKFYAMLVEGVQPQHNAAIFDASSRAYNNLAAKAANFKDKPKVITEMPDKGTWLVPGGKSYAARLLMDAGASYPFASNGHPGSVPMPYEKVYMAAQDADFWLVKSFGSTLTLDDIAANQPFNKNFWAYSNGGIFCVDTSRANLFEETPFHPERLLADYVAIFHRTGAPLRYYTWVEK